MKTDGTNPPGQGIFGLIDINCHILPGTEDGPDNFREAAEMLRIAYDEGIRTIVATPPYNKKNPIMDGDKLDRLVEQLNAPRAGKYHIKVEGFPEGICTYAWNQKKTGTVRCGILSGRRFSGKRA